MTVWNYKSAIVSALVPRADLLRHEPAVRPRCGARRRRWAELLFRFVASGFYGALTQSFRRIEPPLAGTLAALVLLPALGHSAANSSCTGWRGTPQLGASITASVAFTCVSTTFNLFAMRRGALITGDDSRPLWHDLARMPALVTAFLLSWRSRPFI